MEIAQSKPGVLNNERCKDDNLTGNFTDDDCNTNDEANLYYGTHETQECEGGEADLHKHFDDCKKNPGHTRFIPVNEFNIKHLPEGDDDQTIVDVVKATADLTFRVDVKIISTKRPQFWPNTNKPYPFYDKRGVKIMRVGTGSVWDVNKWTEEDIKKHNKGTCQCQKCQHSDTPSKVWGEVLMYTAAHVVFDDTEARNMTCKLFYDRQDSPLVTLSGWTVVEANIEQDKCELKCVTCDVDLLDKLVKMTLHWFEVWSKLPTRSKDGNKLTYIVSHPHGCPKQVSIGHWINRYKGREDNTRYTYTTCTCPGSSGAYVHLVGCNGLLFSARHVHSGANSEGANVSAAGRE